MRPPVKDTYMEETFRHLVVKLAAPSQDLRKDRAVAISTPDPAPECKANRACRKDTLTHARMAPIPMHSSIHVKGSNSYATHVEYSPSGAADDGSLPDFNRRG